MVKRLIKAALCFITVLCRDPVEAHQRVTEILGIRG